MKAQTSGYIPALPSEGNMLDWQLVNRSVSCADKVVTLNAKSGNGLMYMYNYEFTNGTIELDIKGMNNPGRSFVGLAFHILNDSTFDAVYFRPFNFKNEQRKSHSSQYISMPKFDWSLLRESFPGKYENTVQPVPDPDDWFHTTICIDYPVVKVYVNQSKEPSLCINQISKQGKGLIGFWVGNGSEGSFKNLKITAKDDSNKK